MLRLVLALVASCLVLGGGRPSLPTLIHSLHDPKPRYAPVEGVTPSLLFFQTYGIAFNELHPFCQRNKYAVICEGHEGTRLSLHRVIEIDNALRDVFVYHTDDTLYNKDDWWVNWTRSGDCEDYALTLSELLARMGESGSQMKLVMLTVPGRWGGAHAMLLVNTRDAGEVEIGVGPQETPKRFNPKYNIPEAYIRMDGRQKPIAFKGFVIDGLFVDRV